MLIRKPLFLAFTASFVAALVVGAVLISDARATYPGFNGLVGYVANNHLWTMDGNGGSLTQVTDQAALYGPIAWDVTGQQAATNSDLEDPGNSDIYSLDIGSGALTRLTTADSTERNVRFIPDGSGLSFESDSTGFFEIYRMDFNGQNVAPITAEGVVWQGFNHHVWSPDGTMIAATAAFEIVVMNADGSNVHTLTNAPNADQEPDWSPDGTKIVFTSSRDNNQEIYVMNADGSGQQNLSNAPDSSESSPQWSPDGETIIFRSDRNALGDELYSMNPQGGDITKLTDVAFVDVASPRWQSLGVAPTQTAVPTAGPPTPVPEANVDCDTDIDELDVIYMLLFLVGLAEPTACLPPGTAVGNPIKYVGDVDCDGDFDVQDVVTLLGYMAGARPPALC